MPSLPSLPSSSSSLSSPLATSSAVTGSQAAKQIAWQAALYLVVTLAIVAIFVGLILLIWNDGVPKLTRQREKMETARHDSTFILPSASRLVHRMLQYFATTLFPAFQYLGRATFSSLGSASAAAAPRPQLAPDLPLFRPSGFQEPRLAAPRPAMPRDTSSFRVQSNPYSGSEPSSLPSTPSPSRPAFPGLAGSAL